MNWAPRIAARLRAKGPRNGWWSAKCPFHEDKNPSFGFTDSGYHCMAPSCGRSGAIGELAEHLGLKERERQGRGRRDD